MLSNAMTQVWTFQTLREPEVEPKHLGKQVWDLPPAGQLTYNVSKPCSRQARTCSIRRTPLNPLPNLVVLACTRS
jgi:hypothetical protein